MKRADLPIESPCTADWDAMTPEGRKKFCGECKTYVHDMSTMTKREADAFRQSNAGQRLCVRYACDAVGNLVFADTIVPSSALTTIAKRFAAAAIGVGIAAGAAASFRSRGSNDVAAAPDGPSCNRQPPSPPPGPAGINLRLHDVLPASPVNIPTPPVAPREPVRHMMGDVEMAPPEPVHTMGLIAVPDKPNANAVEPKPRK